MSVPYYLAHKERIFTVALVLSSEWEWDLLRSSLVAAHWSPSVPKYPQQDQPYSRFLSSRAPTLLDP